MDHPVVENLYELVVWPKGTQPHILDIGANVGQFATEMRSIFGNAHIPVSYTHLTLPTTPYV